MRIITSTLLFFVLLPNIGLASHNEWDIDRDDLDDNPVETFPLPILFGIDYEDINPDFGDPRGDGTRFHEGEDFLAPLGAPIVSPTEAIVIRTGEGTSAGKYVYTANPGGETFRYMHLDTIARNLDRGDMLRVGDFIGTVGDTGNAGPGQYHLHLEVRDEDNEPTDPYPRIATKGWSVSKKMQLLEGIFDTIRTDEGYAALLVATFGDELIAALHEGYSLPAAVEAVLDEQGVVPAHEQLQALELAFQKLPLLITENLSVGDSGPQVAVLQLYLMFMSPDSSARSTLRAAGPTGYFGSATEAALIAYQKNKLIDSAGRFDGETKRKMLDHEDKLDLF